MVAAAGWSCGARRRAAAEAWAEKGVREGEQGSRTKQMHWGKMDISTEKKRCCTREREADVLRKKGRLSWGRRKASTGEVGTAVQGIEAHLEQGTAVLRKRKQLRRGRNSSCNRERLTLRAKPELELSRDSGKKIKRTFPGDKKRALSC